MKKTRFDELRGAREEKDARRGAQRLPLALVLVVLVLIVVAYFADSLGMLMRVRFR